METFVIIQVLSSATILLIGGALFFIWRVTDRRPFLLHWSLYEFALAGTIAMAGVPQVASIAMGVGVTALLLGAVSYRRQRPPPRIAFVLTFLVITLPGVVLLMSGGLTAATFYGTAAMSIGYLAAAALFVKEGGSLNTFIAAVFVARIANVLTFPLWDPFWNSMGKGYLAFGVGQVLALMAGVGMLMAGFEQAYCDIRQRQRELSHAYNQSGELMLHLELRNRAYREACEKAEAANASKTQFLANMTHELRAPLTAILGFAEVLRALPKEEVMEKVSACARNIHNTASGLQAFICDILNLSRIEAGALELQQQAGDLNAILGEVCRQLQSLAKQKGITLDHVTAAPIFAHCDRLLTRQALINGISNAIKYTERGGRVACSSRIEDGFAVAIIEDNGTGIDEASLTRAFEPFWQASNSFATKDAVLGFGLNIARSYVEAQGGRIELKPARDRGTQCRIKLPLAADSGTGTETAPG